MTACTRCGGIVDDDETRCRGCGKQFISAVALEHATQQTALLEQMTALLRGLAGVKDGQATPAPETGAKSKAARRETR